MTRLGPTTTITTVAATSGGVAAVPALASTATPRPRGSARLHGAIFILLALTLTMLPFFVYPIFLMKVMCFGLFAAGFNLLLGFGGLMSFGHAAYFGLGSYVSAHAAKVWGLPPDLAILTGTLAALLLGLTFGAVAIRRQGIYFAMITLALAQMVYFVSLQSRFTGGEDGIQSVPRGRFLGLLDTADDRVLYGIVAVLFLAGLMLIRRIVHSPFGQVLQAIRENEPRALSLGYRVGRYRLAVFVMSATICGLAGAMKAIVFQLASLTDVHWSMSGEVVLMTLIGGLGTLFGPPLGALVVVAMDYDLASIGGWIPVIEGTVFVLCVLGFRAGIVGVVAKRLAVEV